MFYQIGGGDLYRVTRPNTIWPVPVRGDGAFYIPKNGNRYNGPHQKTLSCSEDPLAAITEGAFYQALEWRDAIANSLVNAVAYPLVSEHDFWAFRIDPLPPVIDLEHAGARVAFGYSPHVVTNPGQNYRATQAIADSVRVFAPPVGSPDPIPEGVRAPAGRTPKIGAYQPKQLALFGMEKNPPAPHPPIVLFDQRSNLSAKLHLEYKFFAASPASGPVGYQSVAINWTKPKFRFSTIRGEPSISPVPVLVGRPGGKAISLNRWLTVNICY